MGLYSFHGGGATDRGAPRQRTWLGGGAETTSSLQVTEQRAVYGVGLLMLQCQQLAISAVLLALPFRNRRGQPLTSSLPSVARPGAQACLEASDKKSRLEFVVLLWHPVYSPQGVAPAQLLRIFRLVYVCRNRIDGRM